MNISRNKHIVEPEETHLENLERLVLSSNHFTRSIPKEIGNMKKLRKLMLSGCNLLLAKSTVTLYEHSKGKAAPKRPPAVIL